MQCLSVAGTTAVCLLRRGVLPDMGSSEFSVFMLLGSNRVPD